MLAIWISLGVLVGVVSSHSQRRAKAAEHARSRLADDQSALNRVATLVAEGSPPPTVFAIAAEQVAGVLRVRTVSIVRFDPDGSASEQASFSEEGELFPVGTRWLLDGTNVVALVRDRGRAARIDGYSRLEGAIAETARKVGIGSTVGVPIVAAGRLWGAMVVSSAEPDRLPADTETRLEDFTELVGTAIANMQARSELAASRARFVATTDETRRRFERDLHDGVQQRLISLSLELRTAEALIQGDREELRTQLARIGEGLSEVLEDLREFSRGLHPAIVSEGGLAPALKALARRSALPVELDLHVDRRLPESVEVAAYYVVSEAMANAAKHAEASLTKITAQTRNGMLDLTFRDDGVGGADPTRGTGLTGLADRVEALGGRVAIISPPGHGTSIHLELPVEPRTPSG